jgi:hypothetical protein
VNFIEIGAYVLCAVGIFACMREMVLGVSDLERR